jgi:hypothetical protein
LSSKLSHIRRAENVRALPLRQFHHVGNAFSGQLRPLIFPDASRRAGIVARSHEDGFGKKIVIISGETDVPVLDFLAERNGEGEADFHACPIKTP